MAANGTNKKAAAVIALNSSTATSLSAGRPTGGVIMFQNRSAINITIWNANVTYANGILLLAATDTSISSHTDSITQDAWYGISESGTPNIHVFETE